MMGRTPAYDQGHQQKKEDRRNGNQQQHAQDRDTKIYLPIDGAAIFYRAQKVPRLQREKEERLIVADWRNVEPIAAAESGRIVATDQLREGI